eukprot:813266-Rhodomonas_salina.1
MPISLSPCYAMSGTQLSYPPMPQLGHILYSAILFLYALDMPCPSAPLRPRYTMPGTARGVSPYSLA